MSANLTRQYRPISNSETGTNDGLSVRFASDMADNLNNYAMYLGSHKVIGQLCVPEWQSHDSTAAERVVWMSAPRRVPDGFTHLMMVAHHYRTEGTEDVTWTLYCSGLPYIGAVGFATSGLIGEYYSATITTSSGDLARTATGASDSLRVARGPGGWSYLTLTATNGDASTRGALTSLDAWPSLGITQAVVTL